MRALALITLLAACAAPQQPDPTYALQPYAQGVQVLGTGQEIGFGRTFTSAAATFSKVKGPDFRRIAQPDCIVLMWDDGFEAHFTPDFSGWRMADQSAGRLC